MDDPRRPTVSGPPPGKPKDYVFYFELLTTTVLSLIAASIWIEFFKTGMYKYLGNDVSVLFATAVSVSLLAIFGLQSMFKARKV